MFANLNEESKKMWVFYALTNSEPYHIGIIELGKLSSVVDIVKGDSVLLVLKEDIDRLKLVNYATEWATKNGRTDLRDSIIRLYQSWSKSTKSKKVICHETGDVFDSIADAAMRHGLSYNSLWSHLKRKKSFNTVKGNTYSYVGGL